MNKGCSAKKEIYTPTTPNEIKEVEALLLKHSGSQIRDIWRLGLLLGLRIGELLQLKFEDLRCEDNVEVLRYHPLNNVSQEERTIRLMPEAVEIINNLKKEFPADIYIFQSRNSRNRVNKEPMPISRQAVFKAFNDVGLTMNKNLTVHSMRHALAANIILNTKDLSEFDWTRFTNEIINQYHSKKRK